MVEALVVLMLGQVAVAALLALLAWIALRSAHTGSARARHAIAATCFYTAALWPLASLLPQRVTATWGPERVPLFDVSALMLNDVWLSGTAHTIAIALLCIAASVSLIRLTFTARAAWRGEKIARNATLVSPRPYGFDDKVRVGMSDEVEGPVLMGLLKPTILFPPRLRDTDELPALLRHELAHLQRRDLSAAMKQRIIEDLCWWNWPLHRLGRWLNEQREMSCDEWAADKDGDYARALAHETRGRAAPPPLAAGIDGAPIERRLERLAETKRRPIALMSAVILFAAAAGAIAAPRIDRGAETHIGIATS